MSNNPLDSLFSQLRGEGRLDSQGHFTLDVARALEKMRQFQLQDARLYVLNLVAAAVANGARFIRMESTPDGFFLESDGDGYSFENLSELFSSPFMRERGGRALEELAIGLFGTRGLAVKQLCLESWHGEAGARMTIMDGRLEIARLVECPFPPGQPLATRLTLREKASLLDAAYGLLGKVRKSRPATQEAEYLQAFCTYSPVHLRLNGEPLSQPVPAGAVEVALEFVGPGGRRFDLSGGLSERVVETREGPYAAVLILEGRPLPGDPLTVVINGVNYTETEARPAYPNARVVLEADYLRKDFSQSRILRDEQFSALLEWVDEQLDWLAAEMLARSNEHEMLVLPVFEQRLRERKSPGRDAGLSLAREMAHFKLFRMLHAGPISLGALARQYMQHGYLPFVDAKNDVPPNIPALLEDGSAIVHCTGLRARLLDAFFQKALRELKPHPVRLDRLKQPDSLANIPRLPPGDYLVRRISEHTRLELGVPAGFPRQGVRYTLYRGGEADEPVINDWSTWLPNGLEICADTQQSSDDPANEKPHFNWRRVETAVCSMLGEIIEALLWEFPPEEPVRSWAAAHLLEYFWVAAQKVRGESPAELYFRLSEDEVRSRLKFFDLPMLARQPLLQLSTGAACSVESLYRSPLPVQPIGEGPGELPLEGEPRVLVREREAEILESFLGRPLRGADRAD